MNTDASNKPWPLPTIIGIGCVVALIAMIIQSLVHFFSPPPETRASENAVTATVSDKTGKQPDIKSGEDPLVHPVSGAAPATATSRPQPEPPQKSTGVKPADFKTIQERENGRRATIENMRQTIRSENLDTNAVIQQEKKLKEIEDSGASFM